VYMGKYYFKYMKCSCALQFQHVTIVIHQSWDLFGGAGEIHTNMDVYE